MARVHRNISFATAESFDALLRHGDIVTVRERETRELRNRITQIARPRERCVFLPGRRNDVFGQVAETFWVIGGRNDLPWLTRYVPRAPEFSDDGGQTWRSAYGPRLRFWTERIDQVDAWRRILVADPCSRRAVGVLFNPAHDFVDSKDIPCNNWLSWLIRDGKLHLNIAVRSNDAMWGFSGVNAFEWSVLQEMMAFWVAADVGEATYFATSYHIYAEHYERAANVVSRFYGVTPYDFGIRAPNFSTPWADFGPALTDWFAAEAELFRNPNTQLVDRPATRDHLLASTLRLLRLKWGAEVWSQERLATELAAMPEDDLAAAAYEFFGRKQPELLAAIPQPGIAAFFRACRSVSERDAGRLKSAIKHLHARKNASYANAWKRRGETVSILPNIARKVDRLRAFADSGLSLAGESVLDTALDLYIYVTKYRLFLSEQAEADTSFLPAGAPTPISDHDQNFEYLIDGAVLQSGEAVFGSQIDSISSIFEELWPLAEAKGPIVERQTKVAELCSAAERLLGHLKQSEQGSATEFISQELTP